MKNKKVQKVISFILILVIIAPSFLLFTPKRVNAVLGVGDVNIESGSSILHQIGNAIYQAGKWVLDKVGVGAEVEQAALATKTWYEEILEQVLMAIARKALQEITKSTVNWINTGFHGSPLFLENPESFFKDIAKSEVKNLVDMFGYDSLKYPFGKDFAINTINTYKQTLENNASYSLSRVMTDPVQLRNYQNNFNYGGWNAFLVNTQYPQNNYIGFQMLATEELARRVQGTASNAAEKVQTTLQQGMGFLSPKTCPSNPGLSAQVSEYNTPSFDSYQYDQDHPIAKECPYTMESEEHDTCVNLWNAKKVEAQREFKIDSSCPGGWVSTTPGSVVSSQITNALGSQFRQTELGAAMGNSLSTIFDALLNKFIGDGLNSLTSSKNKEPVDDNWSYNGLTLGSPTEGGTNSSWDSGPDEEIILDKFKKQLSGKTIVTTIKEDGTEEITEEIGNTNTPGITRGTYIPGDIANTEIEIILLSELPSKIDNRNPLTPGIVQLAKTLDQCIPGPDKNWETRLTNERDLMIARFGRKKGQGDDLLKVRAGDEGIKELKFTVNAFKNWVITKIIGEIPGSGYYTDALKAMDDLSQQSQEAIDLKQKKSQALSRLKAFEKSLATITKQPTETDPDFEIQEGKLIAIKKQYNSIRSSISSSVTIENARAVLDSLNDQIQNLKELNIQCTAERVAAGWDPIGGEKSKQNGITELEKFCSIPIVSGYSHGVVIRNDEAVRSNNCTNKNYCKWPIEETEGWFTFRNPNFDPSKNTADINAPFIIQPSDMGLPGFEDLPMVNAIDVFGDDGGDVDRVSIEIDCGVIFRASPLDYTSVGEISI